MKGKKKKSTTDYQRNLLQLKNTLTRKVFGDALLCACSCLFFPRHLLISCPQTHGIEGPVFPSSHPCPTAHLYCISPQYKPLSQPKAHIHNSLF